MAENRRCVDKAMDIQHADVLAVIAEVSAAFVGFSLAIGLLQPDQPGAALRKQAMQSVAELGLIAAGGAVVILVLNTFAFDQAVTWRVGSLVTALVWGVTFFGATRRFSGTGKHWHRIEKFKYAGWLSILGVLTLGLNGIMYTPYAGAVHVAGLFLALVTSAFMFLVSTFIVGANDAAG